MFNLAWASQLCNCRLCTSSILLSSPWLIIKSAAVDCGAHFWYRWKNIRGLGRLAQSTTDVWISCSIKYQLSPFFFFVNSRLNSSDPESSTLFHPSMIALEIPHLGAGVDLTSLINRWTAEPIGFLMIPATSFISNAKSALLRYLSSDYSRCLSISIFVSPLTAWFYCFLSLDIIQFWANRVKHLWKQCSKLSGSTQWSALPQNESQMHFHSDLYACVAQA